MSGSAHALRVGRNMDSPRPAAENAKPAYDCDACRPQPPRRIPHAPPRRPQDLLTRYAWGEIWTRPGLPRKTRSLLTIVMLVALNRPDEFRMHLRAALRICSRATRGAKYGLAQACRGKREACLRL